jgi:glycerol uptake facilitator-like aquaporin
MFILVIVQHKDGRLCETLTADGLLAKATVALALMAAILVAGGYSGGCFNPAVGLA